MFYERGAKALRGVRIAAIAAATGLAMLSGATSAAADTVVKWLHLETDPNYVAVWRKIADQYEAQPPGVKIQMQFLANEAFKAKLPTLLQSSDAPDFFFSWGGGVLKQQEQTGTLMDLTAAMNAKDGAWLKAYNPAA
ncbi:ABC transporter substrate-binding protein, partial [Pseudomonas brassicacearum]|uniref:ABC transporter substrate-binding protein n=1 Tax=Pseudomonas brassicacearum TaxID=930166 RepID=UPI0011CE3977